jgi:hypothetical protein
MSQRAFRNTLAAIVALLLVLAIPAIAAPDAPNGCTRSALDPDYRPLPPSMVTAVLLASDSLTLAPGQSVQLCPIVEYGIAYTRYGEAVTWSGPAVDGLFLAGAPGTYNLIASLGLRADTIVVTVR